MEGLPEGASSLKEALGSVQCFCFCACRFVGRRLCVCNEVLANESLKAIITRWIFSILSRNLSKTCSPIYTFSTELWWTDSCCFSSVFWKQQQQLPARLFMSEGCNDSSRLSVEVTALCSLPWQPGHHQQRRRASLCSLPGLWSTSSITWPGGCLVLSPRWTGEDAFAERNCRWRCPPDKHTYHFLVDLKKRHNLMFYY